MCLIARGAGASRCELFRCEAYGCELTFGGCLQRQLARVVVAARDEEGRFTTELTTRLRHRFCARSCAQGGAIAARFDCGTGSAS